MSERVKEIKFLHFRGLPDYCCPLKGKSLAVFAGNGKGKSGIVDGIEFLFSGRVRRFHGEGTGGINPEEAIRHIQKKGDPTIELYFTPTNNCIHRRLSQASLQIPSEPTIQDYINTHPAVEAFILRRTQILEFICDQDAARYKKYIQLLGLTAIDDMQKSFVDAAKTAETQWLAAQQLFSQRLSVFEDPISGWIPSTVDSVLNICSEAASALGVEGLSVWLDLESAITRLDAKRSAETKAKIDAYNMAIATLERPIADGLAKLVVNVNTQQTNVQTLKAASDEAAASEIIREAIGFFEAHENIVICPLCEQKLENGYAATFQKLKQRNVALIRLRDAEEKRSQGFDQLITSIQRWADQLTKDLEAATLFVEEDVKSLRNARASALRWLRQIKRLIKDRKLDRIIFPERLDNVVNLRQKLHDDSVAHRNKLIPPDAVKLENAISLLKKAKLAEVRLKAAETNLAAATTQKEVANQAKDAFYKAREKAIQKVFDQIAGKVLQFYKKLHDVDGDTERSECTGLSLKPTSKAAAGGLKFAIQFLGLANSSDPRMFLSEGHLDSLGLCLYLATVRTFNRPNTMLVLDDVLTSIDRDHRHRVAELLFEEFADFQIVLTTHDEHWFSILQSKSQARGDQGNWIFKRIARWTVEKGPESAAFEGSWSYVEENLTDNSYQALGGPLRVVLEDFLKRVAEKLDLDVRYRFDGKYTSGDFALAGIQKRIRERLIADNPADEAGIKQDVGRVFGTGDLINFLSHDNPGRLEVTLSQAKDFVSGLKALMRRCKDSQIIKGIGG